MGNSRRDSDGFHRACAKSIFTNAGYAGGHANGSQATTEKSIITDGLNAAGDANGSQTGAIIESIFGNFFYTAWNSDGCEASATSEGTW